MGKMKLQPTKFNWMGGLIVGLTLFLSPGISMGQETVSKDSEEPALKETVQLTVTSGPGLSFPSSMRVRIKQVEFGIFPPALGVTKYFPFDKFYAQFGVGLGVLGQTDLGLLGGVGWDPRLFWMFGARIEAYSYIGTKGLLYTGTGIGLSLKF